MAKLLEILNSLIEKYQIEEADVLEIQTALAEIESEAESEFSYYDDEVEENSEDEVEEKSDEDVEEN